MKARPIHIDPTSGIIKRVSKDVLLKAGTLDKHGYIVVQYHGRQEKAHRLIYAHVHGPLAPWMEIDHRNGIKNDNRIMNLRWVDRSGNTQNLHRAKKNNKSGFLGISWNANKEKWYASIMAGKKRHFLGYFDDPVVAHQTYLKAKRELHPTCMI